MKNRLFLGLAVLTLAGLGEFASAQTAIEIATDYENKKIAAVEKYIIDNPKAKDLDEAFSILAGAQMALGNLEAIPDILDRRYEHTPKGKEANLGILIGEIGRPYIEICAQTKQKDRGKKFVERLKKDLATHPEALSVGEFIDQIASVLHFPEIGDELNLKFTSTDGREVDLSKFKGKAVLVHFWASWAPECIRQMPEVLTAHDTYHSKGLEVVGISLDDNLGELEKFMGANRISWPQYYDGKRWGNELVMLYGIKAIPSTFLVGKDGKIVAANLHGAELEHEVKRELGIK